MFVVDSQKHGYRRECAGHTCYSYGNNCERGVGGVTVGAATLLAKGLESLGRLTGAIRTNTEEDHVVCVFYLSGTHGVRVGISVVGDLEFGSAGESGEVAGSVPGSSELLGRRLGSRGADRSRGLGGCL